MPEKIIGDILEVGNNINYEYRISKKPTFIKNFLAGRRRKKLKETIDKIGNLSSINSSLVVEYLEKLYAMYPPYGKYKSCRKVSTIGNQDDRYLGSFEFDLTGYEYEKSEVTHTFIGVIILTQNPTSETFTVRYSFLKDSMVMGSFTEDNVSAFYEDPTMEKYLKISIVASSTDTILKCIKAIFYRKLINDIHDFLMDSVERSERINV
jgi:hypothetical protein